MPDDNTVMIATCFAGNVVAIKNPVRECLSNEVMVAADTFFVVIGSRQCACRRCQVS
jgi:hypothetical protein